MTKSLVKRTLTAATAVAMLCATGACGGQTLAEYEKAKAGGEVTHFDRVSAPAEDKAKSVLDAIKPDAELAKLVPGDVRSRGLKVTTSEGYPPMEFFGSDGRTLVGVDPSLARAIANRLGVKLSIHNEDFNSQIPGVLTGRYDMVMSSMTDNSERRQKVTFVDYIQAGNGWVVKKGNPSGMGTAETACGKTVAVVDNGSSLEVADGFSKKCQAAGKKALNVLKFPGDQEGIMQVRSGRADAAINDYPVAAHRAQTSSGVLEAVAIDGDESAWGIAMNPKAKQLRTAVQKALQSLIDDGTYTKILSAWQVEKMAIKTATINDGQGEK